jgi:multimeric flavodoxin WrbA
MKALVLNWTLKPSPAASHTEALAQEVVTELENLGVETKIVRVADHHIITGIKSDLGEGDDWPAILKELLDSEILIMATPTWMGTMSSMVLKVLERINGLYPARDAQNRPVTFNKVAGFCSGRGEDGARHVVSEIAGALMDVGFTIAPHPTLTG